jgi:hypothetical protein
MNVVRCQKILPEFKFIFDFEGPYDMIKYNMLGLEWIL